MIVEAAFYGLLIYTLIREIVFWYASQKLLNKLMSRNYHEYQVGEAVTKTVRMNQPIKIPTEPVEDFGVIPDLTI